MIRATQDLFMDRSRQSIIVRLIFVSALFIFGLFGAGCRGPHSVNLTWHAVPAAGKHIQYNVYRSGTSGGPYSLVALRVPDATYKDIAVTSGNTYYYVVTTVDEAGTESNYSEEISATVP